MTPRARLIAEDYYANGYHDGIQRGLEIAEQAAVEQWKPIRDNLAAHFQNFDLKRRRTEYTNRDIDKRPPAQLIADAYESWGLEGDHNR